MRLTPVVDIRIKIFDRELCSRGPSFLSYHVMKKVAGFWKVMEILVVDFSNKGL